MYGKKYAWVEAVKNWRRINALKKKIESFDFATMPDGRYYGGIMYFGAHTGRFSGSGGNLNLQNLPKGAMFGVNLRNLIAPKPNRRLLAVDLSQIEVRTLCWLAKDSETLKEIAECSDIYEAFAIRFGLWDKSKGSMKANDPALRHKVKAMVLGCGYGAGSAKFAIMSGMTEKEAEGAVSLYRRKMSKVKKLWGELNTNMIASYDTGAVYTEEIPSGRSLNYGRLKLSKTSDKKLHYMAIMPRNGKRLPVKLWGGLLAENLSQALARDIFSDMLCKIHNAGFEIVMHIHDEVVVEVDSDKAEESLKQIIKIMSTAPEWIPDIPLSAEGDILTCYTK
jgi:DNA polymerase